MSWRELEAAREMLALPLQDLWLDYFALGGSAPAATVAAWLAGELEMSRIDHDYLAVALNERFHDRGLGQPVRYSDDPVV